MYSHNTISSPTMAKLIILALAFTALVAFASAHTTTIVTTTIGDDNPVSRQCSQQIQGESLNQCVRYLQQGQQGQQQQGQQGQQQQGQQGQRGQQQQGHQGQVQGLLQQCCNELQRVNEPCQCAAVQQVFQKVQTQQQQQGQQGGRYGSQQLQGLKMKAQNLPNQCNLQVRQCPIKTSITTTTITEEENPFGPFGSQQCSRSEVQGRSFNQCQRYVEQQVSGSPILMSINRRQGQMTQEVQQCCNELQNVRKECQCEAMNEVYRQAVQRQQGGGQYGGQGQQETTDVVRSVVQNLRNECNLDVQQCQIPSSMF